MRQVTMYLCNRDPAHCTFQSTDRDAVIQHECGQHLHISVYAYEQWKTLTRKAESAGHAVGVCKNPETDAAFDKACQELADFETTHGLNGLRP